MDFKEYLDEAAMYAKDRKTYWKEFGQELGKLRNQKYKVKSKETDYTREITLQSSDEKIEISHNWKRDGSPHKPVTYLEFEIFGDTADIKLGRFAVWDDANEYADDINFAIEKELDNIAGL